MAYTHLQKIRFKHCDPAGIVFYRRFFEMINDCVEAFFEEGLHYPFGPMHPQNGVPTVQIEAQFTAPSRLGDVIEIMLSVRKVGRTSLDLSFVATGGAEKRYVASSTLVHVGQGGRSVAWPEGVKKVLQAHFEGDNDAT
jgi:4-hydroxybenzoyl-CoA thioesterase